MRTLRWASVPLLAISAAVLVACGGGDPIPPKAQIASITVAGDSLADVGTFGFKFTVQNAQDPKGYPIWTQLVANSFGLDGSAQCAYFVGNPLTYAVAAGADASCTNFAVGGGRINTVNPAQVGSPYLVSTQLEARAAQGDYSANELLMVDGGGNDAADVVGAYLNAQSDGGAALGTLLGSLLTPTEMAAFAGQSLSAENAIGLYMQRLATKLVSDITTHALNKGAQRVLILNAPDITLTPRFAMVLTGVAQQTSEAQAAALKVGIQAWIGAFNATLAAAVAGDTRMAVVDFYADFTDQGANPADYALDDVANPVCPVTGQDSSGLPSYTFPTCTDAALDATAGKTAGWWTRYAFSDSFHPTPYGHQLLAASVSRALARAGWL